MPRFTFRYLLEPTSPFGLPDGAKIVLPAGTPVTSPIVDTRSGQIAGHGSLPVYRTAADALNVQLEADEVTLSLHDNYLHLSLSRDTIEEAHSAAADFIGLFCQTLSVQIGLRFHSTLLHIEDELGSPKQYIREHQLALGEVGWFNIIDLARQSATAFSWARVVDERLRKTFLYFEHACLLREFSQTLPPFSPHAAFSRGVSFLQLFKALTVILGEPHTDHDYQRRFRKFGLPRRFWAQKIDPLFRIRNDEDVAHYRLERPDPMAFNDHFGSASRVLNEVIRAYVDRLGSGLGDA